VAWGLGQGGNVRRTLFLFSICARVCAFGCGRAPHHLPRLAKMLSRNLHEGPPVFRRSTSVGFSILFVLSSLPAPAPPLGANSFGD
jgi:hypothetical protein